MERLDECAKAKPHLGAIAAARRFTSPWRRSQPMAGRPAFRFDGHTVSHAQVVANRRFSWNIVARHSSSKTRIPRR
jgi:hypothetical protein